MTNFASAAAFFGNILVCATTITLILLQSGCHKSGSVSTDEEGSDSCTTCNTGDTSDSDNFEPRDTNTSTDTDTEPDYEQCEFKSECFDLPLGTGGECFGCSDEAAWCLTSPDSTTDLAPIPTGYCAIKCETTTDCPVGQLCITDTCRPRCEATQHKENCELVGFECASSTPQMRCTILELEGQECPADMDTETYYYCAPTTIQ